MLEVVSGKGGGGVATTVGSVITEILQDRLRDRNLGWQPSEWICEPLSFGVSQEEGLL